jgi:hypothetical protein
MSAGFDTASLVQEQVPAAINRWGRPNFWMRYFSPSYYTPVNSSINNAKAECRAVWQANSSYPYLGAISTPLQSRLNGSAAMGHADAQTYVNALVYVYSNVPPLFLPLNYQLYTWLDQEASASLSLAYWNAWASYVNLYSFIGHLPFYAALYCNPTAAPPNCSVIQNTSAAACFGVWSSVPLRCSNSLANQPSWAAAHCSVVPTKLWQYWDEDICASTSANVDINRSASGFNYHLYCFRLTGSP